MNKPNPKNTLVITATAALALFGLLAASCGSSDGTTAATEDAIATYANGAHASYQAALETAQVMDNAIDDFLANPSAEGLNTAKQTWLAARDDYGPTEAYRFYDDSPIEAIEGLVNAWPMDEGYVDYVEGNPDAGIINDPAGFPNITKEMLVEANEQGSEANVSTGWHAIEFLLWGQDLDSSGAGNRSWKDYDDKPNADRRSTYLRVVSDLLIEHLQSLVSQWTPGGPYHTTFRNLDHDEALSRIIRGIGELSRGELAGERMTVAYQERSEEDEHSCFSDNTTNDIVANAIGIQRVLTATYPKGVIGTSILDLVREQDAALADRLNREVAESVSLVKQIPAPFDQHVQEGVSDSDPGRRALLAGITALEDQTDTIVAAAQALGITISVT